MLVCRRPGRERPSLSVTVDDGHTLSASPLAAGPTVHLPPFKPTAPTSPTLPPAPSLNRRTSSPFDSPQSLLHLFRFFFPSFFEVLVVVRVSYRFLFFLAVFWIDSSWLFAENLVFNFLLVLLVGKGDHSE